MKFRRILILALGFVLITVGLVWSQQYNTSGQWVGAIVRFAASTTEHLGLGVVGDADANSRFQLFANGTMKWGGGSTVPDVQLSRTGANVVALGIGDTLVGKIRPETAFSGSGALIANKITVVYGDDQDYALPICDSYDGSWVTVILSDASETISLVPLSGDTIQVGGLNLGADDELDSPTEGATTAGCSITLVCAYTNTWYSTASVCTWVDGGTS